MLLGLTKSKSKVNPVQRAFASNTKSSLESLPPELLILIINDVDHEDIQNFARCCPIVWKTAGKAFDFHERRRMHHVVRLDLSSDDAEPPVAPIEVLRNLIVDDGFAIYPKRAIIGNLSPRSTFLGVVETRNPPLSLEHHNKLRDLLKESRYFFNFGDDPIMGQKHPLLSSSLLLTLFPNLRTIDFRNITIGFVHIRVTVQNIACATRLNRLTIAPRKVRVRRSKKNGILISLTLSAT